MKYKLAIFDLDGTSMDTLQDLTDSCNHILEIYGYGTHTRDEVRAFIGGGVGNFIRMAVPAGTDDAKIKRIVNEFTDYYNLHLADKTAPYENVREGMQLLRLNGIHIAVNSNKIDSGVARLCKKHLDGIVEATLGEREDIPKKPAPDGVIMLMKAFNVSKDETLYIGDSETDIQTAENAEIDCAWVSWGFRKLCELDKKPEHTFDTMNALVDFILHS